MTAPRVVGLDLSLTATGVAPCDGTLPLTLNTSNKGVHRLIWLRGQVEMYANRECFRCMTWDDPDVATPPFHENDPYTHLVVMEGYSYASANQAHQVGELGGVIRLALHEAGVPFVVVAPAALKKYACGKGNAKKIDMVVAARDRLGYEGTDDNEADALWLRAMGLDALGHPVCVMPAVNRAALAKVEWPEVATT